MIMARTAKLFKNYSLCEGINISASKEKTDDKSFAFTNNTVYENGKLTTRKGLIPAGDVYLGNYDALGAFTKPMTVTDHTFTYANHTGKLAYDVWSDNRAFAIVSVYLFCDPLTVIMLGAITVGTRNGQFFPPQDLTFMMGKPVVGYGLYVFLSCRPDRSVYSSGTHEILEFVGGNTGFTEIPDNLIYVPVLYTNGRGNMFNEARKNGWVYEESPQYPEDVNLLTGKFRAFFTSDGYSSGFKLPIWQLDDTMPCVCRIYTSASDHVDWTLPANGHSATINYSGQQITATLDCSTGYLRFTKAGADFPIPKSSNLNGNNVMLVAYKNIPNCREAILTSSGSLKFGDRNYFFGNGFYKNEIYCSSSDEPFYFPESMKTTVGNSEESVTALHANGKNLFAFKNNGIFRITTNEQVSNNEMVLPIDVGRNYKITNRLKSIELSQKIGCNAPNTICTCGNKTVFSATDKKVYSLSENGALSELSNPVNKILYEFASSSLQNAFAFNYEHKYMLICTNRALILDFENAAFGLSSSFGNNKNSERVRWYYLTLPDSQSYLGGYSSKGTPHIICLSRNRKIWYVCNFAGEKDRIPNKRNQVITFEEKDIEFEITTNPYDFAEPTAKKSINSAVFFVSGNGIYEISISGDSQSSQQNIKIKNESVIKIYPFIMPCFNISASIKGKAPFTVSDLSFEYTLKK